MFDNIFKIFKMCKFYSLCNVQKTKIFAFFVSEHNSVQNLNLSLYIQLFAGLYWLQILTRRAISLLWTP